MKKILIMVCIVFSVLPLFSFFVDRHLSEAQGKNKYGERPLSWVQDGLLGKVKQTEEWSFGESNGRKYQLVIRKEYYPSGFLHKEFFLKKIGDESLAVDWGSVYDEQGKLLERHWRYQVTSYRYEGERVEAWREGELIGEGKTDSYGNIIEMKSYRNKIYYNFHSFSGEYFYSGIDLKTRVVTKDNRYVATFEYDSAWRRVKLRDYSKENGHRTFSSFYDQNGNLLEEREGKEKILRRYEYLDWDEKGNWTKSRLTDSEGNHVYFRKIEYFE